MVKADVRRDYYADLGLGPSAESEDVKKQFRKLALRYHPDRNPGKEVEFIAKFQAIQAAHEILSDPQHRLRYDTDRLRAGYGRQYAAHARANTSRRTPASHSSGASAKSQPFSARGPQANHGPSAGAQRYSSYAKAAPQQSWGKKDDGQTRADAFRGFQGMKNGSPNANGWSNFDPKTGRSGTNKANGGASTAHTPRTKSAYEYFKTSAKPTEGAGTARAQSSRRKNGFAPGTAGGDEPMAANTSAYTSTPRDSRHSGYFFDNSVPSPTAKRAEGPEERARSQYANSSGEKTFFSSAWLGRDSTRRASRTNPPSPTPPPSEASRHRSVSPSHLKTNRNRGYAPSTSSSDADDDDSDTDDPYGRNVPSPSHKPKAVPKSRMRRPHYQKPADPRDWSSGTGHDSDSAAAPRNPFAGTFASANFQPEMDPSQSKSSSHGNLRQEFSAKDWQDASQEGWFGFFMPKPSELDTNRVAQSPNTRGRPTNRNSASWARQSAGPSDQDQDSSRSGSAAQQQPTPFAGAKFSADDWVEQFKNMSWAAPKNEGKQTQANAARARSPKKHARTAASKTRPTPQPASVATEAEEAEVAAEDNEQQSDKVDMGGEAMDLDDDALSKPTAVTPASENKRPSRPQPSANVDKTKEADSKDFNLKDLKYAAPFTSSKGGIDNLQDISVTLPFESRAKAPRTAVRDVRPRELACPNPPKRPRRPALSSLGIGTQLVLPRLAWERYVAEMKTYMREWNEFNRRMLRHFNARQEANESGLAPGWISAVGDSSRLNIDQDDPDAEDNNDPDNEDSVDDVLPGSAKGGYTAYLRAIEEDVKVRKHWDVACELHRECILELGELREWILSGGKLV